MSTILMALVIVSLSGATALLWKRKIEEMVGVSILSIIAVLYGFGLFGFLEVGAYLVTGLAAAGGVLCVVLLIKGRGKQLADLLTPGLLVLAVFLLWQLICYRNRVTDHYDDYSHWVLEIKNMVLFQAIPNAMEESTVYFRNYPPATALFAYYWNWLAGALNEGDMFRSLHLMMFSMLLPLLSHLSWKNWKSILPLGTVCVLLPLAFNSDCYNSLLVDSLLGCMTVYPLYFAYTSPERGETLPICCLTLFVLSITKVSGVGIALLVALVIAVDLMGFQRKGSWIVRLLKALALAGSALAAKLSWETYLGILMPKEVAVQAHTNRLMEIVTGGLKPYQQQGLQSYISKLFQAEIWQLFSEHSLLLWLAAFVIVALVATKGAKGDASLRRDRWLLWTVAFAAVLYSAFLLLTYFFHFSEREASVTMASERYLSTAVIFLAGALLVVLRSRYHPAEEGSDGRCWLLMLCLLVAINPVRLENNTTGYQDYVRGAAISRAVNGPSQEVLDKLNAEQDRVYYLSATNNDLTFLINRYEFTPVKIVRGTAEPAEALLQRLIEGGFTHLYLFDADDSFREAYGSLFGEAAAMENGTLYRVAVEGEAAVLLPALP